VTATVCRLSGKRATEGCEDVDVVNNDGAIERRSMVYTDYFVRGTEPSEYCDLHPTRNLLHTIASVFHADKPAPPKIEDTGAVTARTAAVIPPPASAPTTPERAAEPEAKKQKRGFWGTLFGFGRRGNQQDKTTEK
jgi:hypothetical protein